MKSFVLISALLSLVSATVLPREPAVSYDGYKVFRVATNNSAEAVKAKLHQFTDDFWNRDTTDFIDVAIAPKQLNAFNALGLSTTVMHEDLGKAIADNKPQKGGLVARQSADLSWFNNYHAYADHLTFLKNVQALLPSNSEIISSGTSYQGRTLQGIHIWGSGGKGSKPAVLFHGNVHAREWIASMVVEYVAYQLVTGYKSDSTVKSFIDKYDFYIIPIVNPDGFVYSQTNDRLWRKNRQPPPSGSSCYGRDINRNWPYQWTGDPNGASTNPCDQTYKGQAAGDAPENKGLVSLVNSLASSKGIKFYIDWHSYGQYLLTPYGYDCNRVPSNSATYKSLAAGTAKAIAARYGTKFTTGPSCSTLYVTTGSSTDYLSDKAATPYAITFELRDTGNNGFVLPASQIRPSGDEMWDGVKYWLANMQ